MSELRKYFLVVLELLTTENGVTYIRPDWYIDAGLTTLEIIMSDTTPADSFVEVGIKIGSSLIDKIAILNDNGAKELTEEEFNAWKSVKTMILEAQAAKQLAENPPIEE